MDRLSRRVFHFCACCAIPLHLVFGAGFASGQGVIYMVPAGEDPNAFGDGPTVIYAHALRGQSVPLEFFVRGVPVRVRTVFEDILCVNSNESGGTVYYQHGSGTFNPFRPDYIFFQQASRASANSNLGGAAVNQVACPGGADPEPEGTVRFVCWMNATGMDISDGIPKYAGEFVLGIAEDACGTFTLGLIGKSGVGDVNGMDIPDVTLQDLIIDLDPTNDYSGFARQVWDGAIDFDTFCASTDGPPGCPVEADLWFEWTASCTGRLTVHSPGAHIAIYGPGATDPPIDAEEVACVTDMSNTIDVRPGEAYLIRIGTPDGEPLAGTLNIDVEPAKRYGDVAGANGACGPDGIIDLNDILAILNGFAGVFADGCELDDMDLARPQAPQMDPRAACEPDGEIGLFDILAVLDAFGGIDRCCSGP